MKIKLINYGYKKLPSRVNDTDAGLDVHTLDEVIIPAHTTVKIPLGFGLELPQGYMANCYPRSSMTLKGLIAQLPPIDSGYRGEIHAIISNITNQDATLYPQSKIAQIVVLPIILPDLVEKLKDDRGDKGFGSSDVVL